MSLRVRNAVLTATLAAAVAAAAPVAHAQGRERCFGVAPAGGNDGLGDREAPDSSRVDFQGDAWTWVPAGTCLTMPLPVQPDGTPRRGALEPLDRDQP
jgi:uncharacterized membrane protein